MSKLKFDEIVEFLPQNSRNFPDSDDKFLFFFNPINLDEKFLFDLTLKSGVQIFAVITLIQAIGSFLDIFSPGSFFLFIFAILAFMIYFVVSVYAFLATIKENYSYAKVSYIIISVLFLFIALKYICKSIIKIIGFITPWDGDFLKLNFLVYVFGYGIYLFFYLYFIYILYRYKNQLKDPNQIGHIPIIPLKNDEEYILNETEKNE